jgi:hypothetical protein
MNTGTAVGSYIFALIVLLIISLAIRRMIVGWRRRGERQEELIGELPKMPDELGAAILPPLQGLYIGRILADSDGDGPDWLDRIAVGDLGYRSKAVLTRYPHGVLLVRSGARTIWIPEESISAIRSEIALAGKVIPSKTGDKEQSGGVLAIRWRLPSGTLIDTGFRGDDRREHDRWIGEVA